MGSLKPGRGCPIAGVRSILLTIFSPVPSRTGLFFSRLGTGPRGAMALAGRVGYSLRALVFPALGYMITLLRKFLPQCEAEYSGLGFVTA